MLVPSLSGVCLALRRLAYSLKNYPLIWFRVSSKHGDGEEEVKTPDLGGSVLLFGHFFLFLPLSLTSPSINPSLRV